MENKEPSGFMSILIDGEGKPIKGDVSMTDASVKGGFFGITDQAQFDLLMDMLNGKDGQFFKPLNK